MTYELLKGQPDIVWTNTVEHSQYGMMTLEDWLFRADKHASDHLLQIQNNFDNWSKA